MSVEVLSQILLAVVTGIIGLITMIASAIVYRMKANAKRELEEQRAKAELDKAESQRHLEKLRSDIELAKAEAQRQLEIQRMETEQAKAEAQSAVIKAQSFASERILSAEAEVRSIADTHAILMQMIQLMSETSKRTADNDAKMREYITQMLRASNESTEALKTLVVDMGSVKTNLGEHSLVLEAVRQVVAVLPTQLETRTSTITEAITSMVRRVDTLIEGLDDAKKQLIADLIAAIREALPQPTTLVPVQETSP